MEVKHTQGNQIMLKQVAGFEGKDGKGRKIIVAHSFNQWNESNGYGVWVLCENYKAGRNVKTWRYITTNQTKEHAIEHFNKLNK